MIEQLFTRSEHNVLRHCVDLRLHFELVLALQVDDQHSEVRAAQIEGEEFAALCGNEKKDFISISDTAPFSLNFPLPLPLGRSWMYVM